MNKHLRDIIDRVEKWPTEAQEALRRAALEIEQKLVSGASATGHRPTLREVMRSAPLDDVDLERRRTYPHVRDVDL